METTCDHGDAVFLLEPIVIRGDFLPCQSNPFLISVVTLIGISSKCFHNLLQNKLFKSSHSYINIAVTSWWKRVNLTSPTLLMESLVVWLVSQVSLKKGPSAWGWGCLGHGIQFNHLITKMAWYFRFRSHKLCAVFFICKHVKIMQGAEFTLVTSD